jgi:hypothetical protein
MDWAAEWRVRVFTDWAHSSPPEAFTSSAKGEACRIRIERILLYGSVANAAERRRTGGRGAANGIDSKHSVRVINGAHPKFAELIRG